MNKLLSSQHPVWAMAFRPLYLLSALYGALSVLLWGFGYTGTRALPSFLWHAHEMVWGYAGTVVIAFLLTAGATWTQQPPVRGKLLMWIVGLWLAARITAFLPWGVPTGLLGTAFFWLGAYGMGHSVWVSRNSRNYIAVVALVLLGLSHLIFHYYAYLGQTDALRNGLIAGIVMIAGFIGLIGNRIIPFFTARRLNTVQVQTPMWAMLAALVLPMLATALMMTQTAIALGSWFILIAGCIGCTQSYRWFNRAILREPLLWTLHAGYAFSSLGLVVLAIAAAAPQLQSLGVHLLAVGGIGLLTVSMMVRTALGHTARPLYPAPAPMNTAFWLMVAAAGVRALAAIMLYVNPTAYTHSIRLSAVLFAVSLLLYFYRYLPWLTQPRLDGKAG
ncbi:NnrS family protein [Kingella kingae]|uniref:NnrS family protein n=1 Tax=Kingella kingae TaxID=504 RepID=UPI00040AAB09|nr:NnrS family protein [Kingella kingae]MDK4543850.1 NnrS family protein [Kingella kingae]MDK4566019.1 NnrS family protein [Kingella kingae]MDK4590230.1 NnrS family protein [Kingella kingae]MDK4627868.1 NnrS family protein [Kingella kingae]MDK4635593.1 NnrS family protein [Kingella kingae]